jgi:hypothetical protein
VSDTVTSAAVATGDVAAVRAKEGVLAPLFHRDRTAPRTGSAVERALEEVLDTPTIGAIAAIEMARLSSGWSVEIGARNGLPKYRAFAAALVSGGWFLEGRDPRSAILPEFRPDEPVASLREVVAAAHPSLSDADRRRVCQALVRSLEHTLGPDGVRPEAAAGPDDGLLGKKEVLERRVTTVASNVLETGEAPAYAMVWKTEIFERTKEGKDDPKVQRDQQTTNHRLRFNLQRWRTGDRSALLDYYRYVEDWLKDFNSSAGRMRSMPCFATLLETQET